MSGTSISPYDRRIYSASSEWCSKRTISRILSEPGENVFDRFIEELESYYNRSVSTIAEMKQRNDKKAKGTIWELFCQEWLRCDPLYLNVWLFNEVPEEIRLLLKIGTVDNGIDIVAQVFAGFVAIQCKYRGKGTKVTWNTLSTFTGLCAVTGPWHKHIVMTNCAGVSRKIPRTPRDQSICLGSFRGTSRERWLKMTGTYVEHRLDESVQTKSLNAEAVREARLAYFARVAPAVPSSSGNN